MRLLLSNLPVATNKEEAIKCAKSNIVDIILMDLNLDVDQDQNFDGIFATIEILENDIKAKVIILTSLFEEELVINSIIAGAIDYIQKENFKDLPNIFNSIMNNKYNPLKIIAKKYVEIQRNETLKMLTPAEQEVLSFLEQSFTQSQIAENLYITSDTVKKHVRQILRKLDAKNTPEALRNIKFKSLYWKNTKEPN